MPWRVAIASIIWRIENASPRPRAGIGGR
jgi:hypothetical protein